MAVTTLQGNYIQPATFSRAAVRVGNTGVVLFSGTGPGIVNNVYKNQGWYAAGGVFETWQTSPAPSTVPPSGHTLTDIQHQLLEV